MTISQSAEYALRAIVWLAAHPDRKLSTPFIAKGTRVPLGYLSKVLQGLSRAGLVQSCPGRSGGFLLAHRPSEMTVLDVVNAVEPVRRIRSCPLGIESHGSKLCPLHRRLDQVAESAEQVFHQTTISQLLSHEDASPPLCEVKVTQPGRTASQRAESSHRSAASDGRRGRRSTKS